MAIATNIPEPEERIEAALVSILAANCTIPVEGFMDPAPHGAVKELFDTFVSVVVDQTSQDLDFRGARVPHTYQARVTVHVSLADDVNGEMFRDECRTVRAALASLTGDGCEDLGAVGFACDAFTLDSTSSSFEGGDNPTNVKNYAATISGRIINNNNTEAE